MASNQDIAWKSDLFTDIKDEINETSPTEEKLIRVTNRILKDIFSSLDYPGSIRHSTLYYCGDDAEKYTIPSDMKSMALIKLTPTRGKDTTEDRRIRLVSPLRFAQYNSGEYVTIERDQAIEYFKIIHDQNNCQDTYITNCDSLTADGTWSAGTGASNITADSYDYRKGSGAINFDVSGTTATISFARTSVIDISGYTKQQRIRFFLKTPTAPSSVEVRWGSSASAYYKHTSISTQSSGEGFSTTDWNEIEASKASATTVGSPDDENLNYFALIITFSGSTTDTDFIIDNIKAIKPEELDLEYYSTYIARTSASVYSADGLTVTADTTDLTELFNEDRQVLIDGVAYRYLNMEGGKGSKGDAKDYKADYEAGKKRLRIKYPSRRARFSRRRRLPRLSKVWA